MMPNKLLHLTPLRCAAQVKREPLGACRTHISAP